MSWFQWAAAWSPMWRGFGPRRVTPAGRAGWSRPPSSRGAGRRAMGRQVGAGARAELAWVLGRIGSERVRAYRVVLGAYDLPQALPSGVDLDELIVLMGRDKKAVDGLTFVLDGPDGASLVGGVERSDLLAAFARMEA